MMNQPAELFFLIVILCLLLRAAILVKRILPDEIKYKYPVYTRLHCLISPSAIPNKIDPNEAHFFVTARKFFFKQAFLISLAYLGFFLWENGINESNVIFVYLFWIFWATGIPLFLIIKARIKKMYPHIHNEIFGETWADHSIRTSINAIKFFFEFKKEKWQEVDDKNLLLWLEFNRIINIGFYISLFILFFFVG